QEKSVSILGGQADSASLSRRECLPEPLCACHAIRQRRFVCPWHSHSGTPSATQPALLHLPKEFRRAAEEGPTSVSMQANRLVVLCSTASEHEAQGTRTGVAGSRGTSVD